MTIDELERVLRDAMDRAIADGWRIKRWVGRDYRRLECCALGATEVTGGHEVLFPGYKNDSFIRGFDGYRCPGDDEDYHALGQRLAREYVDGVKP